MAQEHITRNEYDRNIRRLEALEAEIMGDPRTGRASLRLELTARMDEHQMMIEDSNKRTEKSLNFIKRVSLGVLIVIFAAFLMNAFDISAKRSESKNKPQSEEGK